MFEKQIIKLKRITTEWKETITELVAITTDQDKTITEWKGITTLSEITFTQLDKTFRNLNNSSTRRI